MSYISRAIGLSLHPGQNQVFRADSRFKVIVAGRRWGKCLALGTRVAMADGTWREVQDVRPGDRVFTVNETSYRIEPREVQAVASNGVRETVVLRTAGRAVRCTPNHPFLVNNAWLEAKDIKPGDLVAVPKHLAAFGTQPLASHELDLLAIWLAEGRVNQVSASEGPVLKAFTAAIDAFGCTLRQLSRYDWAWSGPRLPGRGRATAPTAFLRYQGLWGRDSKTKFIPPSVYALPESQLARFLNLMFATDGCITRRCKNTWALEIGLANEVMLRQIAELLLKFGIRGQIRHKIHKKCSARTGKPFESWRFVTSDPDAILTFADRIGALGKETQIAAARAAALASRGNCNTYLPIQHDEFIRHLVYEPTERGKYGGYNAKVARDLPHALRLSLTSWRKQTPERISRLRYETLRGFSDGYFDPIADGDLAWEEVTAIDVAAEVETFDLQIEGNHNFFAEGLCTHNTKLILAELLRAARKPRQLIWYVAPTYRMAKQIMWIELMEAIPKPWIVKSNETALEIHLANKTRISLKGADKPDTLRGVGINFLALDEVQDMRVEVWETVLRPTLASTRGKGIFAGTPKAYNHLYELFEKGQQRKNRDGGSWASWQFPTISSPFIPVSEIEAARADMDERTFRQEFEATFESMSGRVYYQFTRREHVGEHAFNPNLPVWIGQDFNVDPMSSVILQPQISGEVWAVDEIYLSNSNTAAVCDELERRYWRHFKSMTLFPDPAGANRSSGRGESDLDIFRERGLVRIRFRRKHPPVADRVNAVNRMLRSADGVVRLRVNKSCRHLIESLEQTLYRRNSSEIDKSAGMEHITDALGYAIEFQFPRRRFDPVGLSR